MIDGITKGGSPSEDPIEIGHGHGVLNSSIKTKWVVAAFVTVIVMSWGAYFSLVGQIRDNATDDAKRAAEQIVLQAEAQTYSQCFASWEAGENIREVLRFLLAQSDPNGDFAVIVEGYIENELAEVTIEDRCGEPPVEMPDAVPTTPQS